MQHRNTVSIPMVQPPVIVGSDSHTLSNDKKRMYQSAIGVLLFLSGRKRPEVNAVVIIPGRRASNPTRGDWNRIELVF